MRERSRGKSMFQMGPKRDGALELVKSRNSIDRSFE